MSRENTTKNEKLFLGISVLISTMRKLLDDITEKINDKDIHIFRMRLTDDDVLYLCTNTIELQPPRVIFQMLQAGQTVGLQEWGLAAKYLIELYNEYLKQNINKTNPDLIKKELKAQTDESLDAAFERFLTKISAHIFLNRSLKSICIRNLKDYLNYIEKKELAETISSADLTAIKNISAFFQTDPTISTDKLQTLLQKRSLEFNSVTDRFPKLNINSEGWKKATFSEKLQKDFKKNKDSSSFWLKASCSDLAKIFKDQCMPQLEQLYNLVQTSKNKQKSKDKSQVKSLISIFEKIITLTTNVLTAFETFASSVDYFIYYKSVGAKMQDAENNKTLCIDALKTLKTAITKNKKHNDILSLGMLIRLNQQTKPTVGSEQTVDKINETFKLNNILVNSLQSFSKIPSLIQSGLTSVNKLCNVCSSLDTYLKNDNQPTNIGLFSSLTVFILHFLSTYLYLYKLMDVLNDLLKKFKTLTSNLDVLKTQAIIKERTESFKTAAKKMELYSLNLSNNERTLLNKTIDSLNLSAGGNDQTISSLASINNVEDLKKTIADNHIILSLDDKNNLINLYDARLNKDDNTEKLKSFIRELSYSKDDLQKAIDYAYDLSDRQTEKIISKRVLPIQKRDLANPASAQPLQSASMQPQQTAAPQPQQTEQTAAQQNKDDKQRLHRLYTRTISG